MVNGRDLAWPIGEERERTAGHEFPTRTEACSQPLACLERLAWARKEPYSLIGEKGAKKKLVFWAPGSLTAWLPLPWQ